MSKQYKVRMFESGDGDGSTNHRTVVLPIGRCFSVDAFSIEEAEIALRKDIQRGKQSQGRVYQICPSLGNPEPIRCVAAALDGSFGRVFLEAASGLYAEFRRIRVPQPSDSLVQENLSPEAEYVQQ